MIIPLSLFHKLFVIMSVLICFICRYDASERISAREAMRHPYFKDARETESQKIQSESPRGVISSNTAKSDPTAAKKTGFHNSGKQKALDGSAKINAVLNKALPNINSGAVDENTAKSNFQASSGSDHHASGKHHNNSKHLPFTNSQGIVDESSLPPIAGGGGGGGSKNFSNPNDSTRSNRSLQGQQLKSKKHNKKFKSNYSQDTSKKKSGEQVLRTYGLSGKNTLNSNSEFNKSDVKTGSKAGAGYSHPVSVYVPCLMMYVCTFLPYDACSPNLYIFSFVSESTLRREEIMTSTGVCCCKFGTENANADRSLSTFSSSVHITLALGKVSSCYRLSSYVIS